MQRYECQDVQAVLSGLLDGELDASTSHLAEAHLAQCAPCRTVLQQAEETDDLLRATMSRHETWPSALEGRIRAEVFGVVDGAQVGQRRRRLLLVAWSGWSMAAVVTLGFGLSFSQGWFNTPPMESGASALATGQGADAIESPEPAVWVPPVGSEELALSIFEDGLRLMGAEERESESESGIPNEALAIESESPPSRPSVPEVAAKSAPNTFSEPALAGIESEIEKARELDRWASSLSSRSAAPSEAPSESPTVDPDPIAEAPLILLAAEAPDPVDTSTGEVLHQASILLTVLEQAGQGSFSDVRMVQQALTSDDVLERLAVARGELRSSDSVDLVNRAWTVLEWTTGSVDQDELERVKQSIAMQDLPRRLERLSDQYWN